MYLPGETSDQIQGQGPVNSGESKTLRYLGIQADEIKELFGLELQPCWRDRILVALRE